MSNDLEQNVPAPEGEALKESPERAPEQPPEAIMLEGRINDAQMRLETNKKGAKLDQKFTEEASQQHPDFATNYEEALKTIVEKRQDDAEKIKEEMAEMKVKLETLKKLQPPTAESIAPVPEAQQDKTGEDVDNAAQELKSPLPEEPPEVFEEPKEAETDSVQETAAEEKMIDVPEVAPKTTEEPSQDLPQEENKDKEQPSA